jgi:hypothetical protein
MGAVHRLVLLGQAPQLARYYPTAGGTTTEDPWPDFEALLVERADDIRALLDRTVQTNEVGRSAALIGGFLVVAARTGLPMRVLEIGASAGLNLRWDHFSYEARGATWGDATSPVRLCDFDAPPAPPFDVETTVIERRGCDRNPLDPTTDAGRLTLLSYVWPDQHPRVRLLTGALEVARRVPAQVDKANVTDWLTVQLSEPRPGVATVVYHSIVMQYLTEEERQGVDEVLAGAGTAATPNAPLARLQMEPAGPEAAIHLTMWPSAETELIAKSGYHGARVRWLAR